MLSLSRHQEVLQVYPRILGGGSFFPSPLDITPLPTAMTVAAVPPVLSAVGFTGSGIAASSLAAKLMSVSAIANGGGVPAGGLVATLQSAGKCFGWRTRGRTGHGPLCFVFPFFLVFTRAGGNGGGRGGLQDGLPGFNPPLRFSLFPAEGNVT